MQKFYAHGKLLLSSEYVVIDGATALALPTKKGQTLSVEKVHDYNNKLSWNAKNADGSLWFQAQFSLPDLTIISTTDHKKSLLLQDILLYIQQKKENIFQDQFSYSFYTHLEFPHYWGWGTSSTFINNLAQWADINPYLLLQATMGGSGYDIACASAMGPLLYTRSVGAMPTVEEITFQPRFSDELFFVYLNKKQNTKTAINLYQKSKRSPDHLRIFSDITHNMVASQNDFNTFKSLLKEHEQRLSSILQVPPIKEQLFKDYPGEIKSLGAWGGDFVLATDRGVIDYFTKKGYMTIFPYKNVVLK